MNPKYSLTLVSLAGITAVALSGCSADVTPQRLQNAITQSFDNLYVAQATLLGHPGLTPAAIAAQATCQKGGTPKTPPGGPHSPTAAPTATTTFKPGPPLTQSGPGANWSCALTWKDFAGAPQTGKFEVNAKTSSCFVAGGPATVVGPATITASTGQPVPNPLSEWDVCFNPAS